MAYTTSVGLARTYIYTVYDRIFGDVPAKNTVYTPYIYGSGQPYTSGTKPSPVLPDIAKAPLPKSNIAKIKRSPLLLPTHPMMC